MNIEAKSNPKYKQLLNLFLTEPQNLVVCYENSNLEFLEHRPTGYRMFTNSSGIIVVFVHPDLSSIAPPLWTFILRLITKPNLKVQKNFIKYRNETKTAK